MVGCCGDYIVGFGELVGDIFGWNCGYIGVFLGMVIDFYVCVCDVLGVGGVGGYFVVD